MATPMRTSYQYNQLDTADPDELSVQTDSQSYHEIKIYNDTKDRMWWLDSNMALTDNTAEVLQLAKQLVKVMRRAHSIWIGINESAQVKTDKLGVEKKAGFEYKDELEPFSNQVARYIDFYRNPRRFSDEIGNTDPEYVKFYALTEMEKLDYFREKISDIVEETDKKWNELAARIGFALPLKIAEEKEIFFRGR